MFEDKLLPLLLTLLQDQVHAVRMGATGVLARLGAPGCLGPEWMRAKVLPHLAALFHSEGGSYLQRITVLYALRELLAAAAGDAAGGGAGDMARDASLLIAEGLRDDVPNVRFVAAQIAEESAGALGAAGPAAGELGAAVRRLAASDPDGDVRFYAARAAPKLA